MANSKCFTGSLFERAPDFSQRFEFARTMILKRADNLDSDSLSRVRAIGAP